MVQEFSLRYPLVDGQGNFGSIDGDPPAAMRYTEARLAQDRPRDARRHRQGHRRLRAELRRERSRSRSSCRREVPNLLVNGSSGIAVGMATNIPPHNLSEVVDGLVAAASRTPTTTVERADDGDPGARTSRPAATSTGAAGIREAYTTGRGIITLRAKAHAEKMRGGREAIIVTELPYQVNKATLIEKIARAHRARRRSRASRRSATSRTARASGSCWSWGGARSRRSSSTSSTSTPQMQTTFGIIMLALVGRRPQVVNLKQMLEEFIDFRREVVTRRTRYDLARAEERAHILEGLRKAVDQLDLVIRLIRGRRERRRRARRPSCAARAHARSRRKAILDMRLQRLTAARARQDRRGARARRSRSSSELQGHPRLRRSADGRSSRTSSLALKEEYGDERRTEILDETDRAHHRGPARRRGDGGHRSRAPATSSGRTSRPTAASARRQGRDRHGDQGRGHRRRTSSSPRPTPTSCSSRTRARSTGSRCTRFPRAGGRPRARRW